MVRGNGWVPRWLISYSMEMPQFKNDGLVVTEFLGRFCGGPSRTKPTSINYYRNYGCTNNTISGSVLTQSMQVNSEYGYVFEYAEPG